MIKHPVAKTLAGLSLVALAACSRTPYTPVASEVEPIDATAWAPIVDSFVVLLDTSGSMKGEDGAQSKIHGAQNLVASFNSAVPPYDFQSGMIIFGKGAGTCIGEGTANTILDMAPYEQEQFAGALGSIECAASTTPIAEAIDSTTDMLDADGGPVAVFIVSDFRWTEPQAVSEALTGLKQDLGENLCLHTVKIGDFSGNDALIASMNEEAGCGSAVNAADIAGPTAMSNYVTESLLAPVAYETHAVSATTLFGFDDTRLTPLGKAELADLADYIKGKGMGVTDIDVIGHTCSIGTEGYNGRLSIRRAAVVRHFLASQGIDAALIDIGGMGESQPVADNATEEGREQNRRVEIHVGSSRPGA